jgi:hypothetical protein
MAQLQTSDHRIAIEPMPTKHEVTDETGGAWTRRLVIFLRVMAVISLMKGLYHWGQVLGIGAGNDGFEAQSLSWQSATVYFAVIDLVAAIGLWLATPWGAVLWLTTVISMGAVEVMFPQTYGGSLVTVAVESVFLVIYLGLAWMAAHEHPA